MSKPTCDICGGELDEIAAISEEAQDAVNWVCEDCFTECFSDDDGDAADKGGLN